MTFGPAPKIAIAETVRRGPGENMRSLARGSVSFRAIGQAIGLPSRLRETARIKVMDVASGILFAAAFAVGLSSLLCVTRAIRASGAPARLVWIGRALALLEAAVAIAFPGVLYRELVDIALPRGADVGWMPTGIAQSALLMPLTVVPALVSLRRTLMGGSLVILSAVVSAVFVVYDPFGAFPYRDVAGGLVFDVGPRLLTAALLLVGAAGTRRRPHQSAQAV